MAENTIKFYRKLKTEQLKSLLDSYEYSKDKMDFIIDEFKKIDNNISKLLYKTGHYKYIIKIKNLHSQIDIDELTNKVDDYNIDIHLLRMELNKRLWKNSE